ncbi:MAG: DnaJ domain-containing protein [Nannocystaceae bacterium]
MSRRPPPQPLPDTDDPYVLLDVRAGASLEQIRRAYLRRVKTYKPDRHPAEFRRVREAYDHLREQESWFDAWRQASDVVRQAIEDAGDNGEGVANESESDPLTDDAEQREATRQRAAQREADAEIEAEVEREAQAEERRGAAARGWGAGPTAVDHEPEPEPEHRQRAEHSASVGARLGDLASAVHDELEEGRVADAAALLLSLEVEPLAPQPAFATLLLEVCCAAVWTEPERYDELVARYGDLVAAHDIDHREGALLHRRTVADELPAWNEAVAQWPELRRFVELGSSLRAPAEAELGLRLGQRAAADPTAFLSVLQRAGRAAPGIVTLYVGMAERWARHYGRPLPGSRPSSKTPTVEQAATAIVHALESHRHVRWLQVRPLLIIGLFVALFVFIRSPLSELLAISLMLILVALRAWTPDPAETLYLEVVQPTAATWLWATGATPERLAAALEGALPQRGTWSAFVHPVDPTGHPRLVARDLSLQAFGVTAPMIPRLGKRRS